MISAEHYCASCGAANEGDAGTCFACGQSLKITRPLPETPPGLLTHRYRILAQIGAGGFSVVYRAEDTHFNDHPVAIKAISLIGLSPVEIIEATETFNREVALLSQLSYSGLPRIYHHFSDAETWYMVMDFIEGETLEALLGRASGGILSAGEALDIAQSLCTVLEYLHSRQPPIIFRDLKPGNIIIRTDGHLSIIDFGIARHYKAGQMKDTIPFGSPGYAAPEQYGRAQTTQRSDVYSLGAILHQMLTGDDPSRTPFRFAPLASASNRPALAQLDTLIASMVHMDAGQRPESVAVVKQQIERIAHHWFTRQRHQMRARVLPRVQGPGPIVRQSLASSHSSGGSAQTVSSSGQAQIIIRQSPSHSRRRSGRSSPGSPYWAASAKKESKGLAIASLAISLLSIITIPIFLTAPIAILNWLAQAGFTDFPPWFTILSIMAMSAPSILGIILGCAAYKRTTSQDVETIAASGIAIGLIITLVYVAFLCLFANFALSGFH